MQAINNCSSTCGKKTLLSIAVSSTTKGSYNRISRFINNNPQNYDVNGEMIDLTQISNIAQLIGNIDSYGVNSTVKYLSPFYNGISGFENNIPTISSFSKNDYILFSVNLNNIIVANPTLWYDTTNLFTFTPYAYNYNLNNIGTSAYANIDQSIFFTKSSFQNNIINICCTSSVEVSKSFSKQGYYISKMPIEYINNITLNFLFRIGIINGGPSIDINSYITTTYYKNTNTKSHGSYFTSKYIISTFPPNITPQLNASQQNIINTFLSLKQDISTFNYSYYLTFNTEKYLSNYTTLYGTTTPYNINFAITNFYIDANLVNYNPSLNIEQMNANNSCENYLMTVRMPTTPITYNNEPLILFILYLNQNSAGYVCTSNIQIYNGQTSNLINNGTILTGPNLPMLSTPNYPHPINNTFSLYGIESYTLQSLNSQAPNLIICERLSYGLVNNNAVNYNSIYSCSVYICTQSDYAILTTLLTDKYPNDLTITNN